VGGGEVMNVRWYRLILLFLFIGAPCARADGSCPSCPNVILLMVDTLRADKLGAYGFEGPSSPAIDALAAKGIVFERAISQASWTRASVASIVTSRYPRDVNVIKERWDPLGEEALTLAEILKAHGYYTVGVTANPQLNTSFGFAQGFDHYNDSTVVFPWMKAQAGQARATRNLRVMNAPDALTQLLKEIQSAPHQPVFAQIMLMDVHAHDRITRVSAPLKKYQDAAYVQAVRNTSDAIGEFIDALSREAIWKNTVIVFTSDHGEGLSDFPDVANSAHHGNLLYRALLNVPLIVYGAGARQFEPKRIKTLVQSLDIAPTVLDFAGIAAPPEMAGHSLRALWDGRAAGEPEGRRLAYSETAWREVDKSSITDGEWLFVENRDSWPGTNPEELQPYGERQDGAKTDVKDQKPQITRVLKEDLEKWRAQFKAKTPPPAASAPVTPKEVEQLKTLGYL
jgi:arylsulfatase A-like enzyme